MVLHKKMPQMSALEVHVNSDHEDCILIVNPEDTGNGETIIAVHVTQVDTLIEWLQEAQKTILATRA